MHVGNGRLTNHHVMTIIYFLILLLLCWAMYKSIDWFEKI